MPLAMTGLRHIELQHAARGDGKGDKVWLRFFWTMAFAFSCSIFWQAADAQDVHPKGAEEKIQKKQAGRVATMNVDLLMMQSDAARQIQEKSEKVRAEIKAEVEVHEKVLRKEDERVRALEVQGDPSFASEYKKLEKKFQEAQKKYSAREAMLNEVFQKAREQVVNTLSELVEVYAQQEQIMLVLPAKVVIYEHESLDITQEMLRRLNKALPKIEINVDEPKTQ